MPFGVNAAPATFQYVMQDILDNGDLTPPPNHSTYLDDCGVGGTTLAGTWGDTLSALKRLTWAGLPINIWKCEFLVPKLTILGRELTGDGYSLGPKAIKRVFGTELPTTLKEVQSLAGKLLFASAFIPGYEKKVKPI